MKKPKTFSGENAKVLKDNIESLMDSSPLVWSAFRSLVLRCQELEKRVEELEKDSRVRLGRGK